VNPQEHHDLLDALRVADNYAGELGAQIEVLNAEIARLRAAGRALAVHAIEDDEINDTLKCQACGAFLIDGVPFEHLNNCPTRVFTEENE
jgi:hypothetical protein